MRMLSFLKRMFYLVLSWLNFLLAKFSNGGALCVVFGWLRDLSAGRARYGIPCLEAAIRFSGCYSCGVLDIFFHGYGVLVERV